MSIQFAPQHLSRMMPEPIRIAAGLAENFSGLDRILKTVSHVLEVPLPKAVAREQAALASTSHAGFLDGIAGGSVADYLDVVNDLGNSALSDVRKASLHANGLEPTYTAIKEGLRLAQAAEFPAAAAKFTSVTDELRTASTAMHDIAIRLQTSWDARPKGTDPLFLM